MASVYCVRTVMLSATQVSRSMVRGHSAINRPCAIQQREHRSGSESLFCLECGEVLWGGVGAYGIFRVLVGRGLIPVSPAGFVWGQCEQVQLLLWVTFISTINTGTSHSQILCNRTQSSRAASRAGQAAPDWSMHLIAHYYNRCFSGLVVDYWRRMFS